MTKLGSFVMLAAFTTLVGCQTSDAEAIFDSAEDGRPRLDGDQRAAAGCSATTRLELDVSSRADGYEVELDLESGTPGERWAVDMWHNGALFVKEERTTSGDDGYFWIEREVPDLPGTDLFEATATSLETGETCALSVERAPS